MQHNTFLGIEIGGTKLQICAGDEHSNIVTKFQFQVDALGGGALIRKKIEETISEIMLPELAGIGIGFGGPVNYLTGDIASSFQVDGWSGFNIIQWMKEFAGVKVAVDNDANVAALAEALYGAGKDFERVLYLTLGSGVGGGFVIDQKIYHGRFPGEIEIGHIRLEKAGKTLESSCSGWAVDKKIRDAITLNPSGMLAQLVGDRKRGEAMVLLQALNRNDDISWKLFNDTTDDLAFGLSHAIHILNPDAIVIGGGLSYLGDILMSSLTEKIPGYLMRPFIPAPPIFTAALKDMTVPVGALALARQSVEQKVNHNNGQ
ncbi:ROK family protein [Pollutibacter soli]|uniref:ROK family protein n=1 Tax=Pollutibacter soli TaxID=3034157 RepID=UPI003013AA74